MEHARSFVILHEDQHDGSCEILCDYLVCRTCVILSHDGSCKILCEYWISRNLVRVVGMWIMLDPS